LLFKTKMHHRELTLVLYFQVLVADGLGIKAANI